MAGQTKRGGAGLYEVVLSPEFVDRHIDHIFDVYVQHELSATGHAVDAAVVLEVLPDLISREQTAESGRENGALGEAAPTGNCSCTISKSLTLISSSSVIDPQPMSGWMKSWIYVSRAEYFSVPLHDVRQLVVGHVLHDRPLVLVQLVVRHELRVLVAQRACFLRRQVLADADC